MTVSENIMRRLLVDQLTMINGRPIGTVASTCLDSTLMIDVEKSAVCAGEPRATDCPSSLLIIDPVSSWAVPASLVCCVLDAT